MPKFSIKGGGFHATPIGLPLAMPDESRHRAGAKKADRAQTVERAETERERVRIGQNEPKHNTECLDLMPNALDVLFCEVYRLKYEELPFCQLTIKPVSTECL